jgi:two-component system chemotaxis response regulator CheB
MATHDIVVIGASAGGVQALRSLVSALPAGLPATLFIAQHSRPDAQSLLPEILSRSGPLPAEAARDRSPFTPGRIYIAPPDHHLLVEADEMRVIRGPRENRHRPAIDPLFRSAAWAFGPRVVGVVLSGYLDDGAMGLWAIRTCGGTTVIQDPRDAMVPDMPLNAARTVEADYTLPLSEIAALLTRLAREEAPDIARPPEAQGIKTQVEFAKGNRDIKAMNTLGKLSPFTCPACRGALWELESGEQLSYRCHTGHAFSSERLLGDQTTAVETALYSALRAVEEKSTALRRLAERHLDRSPSLTKEYDSKARDLDGTAETLRNLLAGGPEETKRPA